MHNVGIVGPLLVSFRYGSRGRLPEWLSGTAGVPQIAADLLQHHISAAVGQLRTHAPQQTTLLIDNFVADCVRRALRSERVPHCKLPIRFGGIDHERIRRLLASLFLLSGLAETGA